MENDIIFVTKNLEKWVKDEKAPDIDLTNSFVKPKIRKDPLGCVLVIGWVQFTSFLLEVLAGLNFWICAERSISPSSSRLAH